MKTIIYCKCGAKTTPRNWRNERWLKVVTTYTDGNRWTSYVCPVCRNKNVQAAIPAIPDALPPTLQLPPS